MDIKPLYHTGTIELINPVIKETKLKQVKKVKSAYSNIPKGIVKLVQWEKIRQIFTMILTFGIFVASCTMIYLYWKVYDSTWIALIIPSIIGLLSLYKLLITTSERRYINVSLKRYSEDLKIGLTTTPAFVAKLYRELIRKQVRHNWFTFAIMFYGGTATLLLWWLKDTTWWIFEFDKWIHAMFSNPSLMTILFALTLLFVVVLHLVLTIQRKRRIMEIDSYLGVQAMAQSDIESIKSSENKMWRRIFIITFMIILVIPLIVRIFIKLIRGKK